MKKSEMRIEVPGVEQCYPVNLMRLKERESEESKYKRAFKVACELLNDDYLYGYDRERIYAEVMRAEGVFSSDDYERYILEHLDRLSGTERSGEV